MVILGKKVLGSGTSFEITEEVESILTNEGYSQEQVDSNYERRSYSNRVVVEGTTVTFTYNSSIPGYGTIRWSKGQGSGHQKIVDAVVLGAEKFGISSERILRNL